MIYEPPYGPEDLKEPPLEGSAFIDFLHAEKEREYPATPPLYQLLYDGQLSDDGLRVWAKDMYSYWDHALVYSTGAIFVKTNHEDTRTHLLRKLVDLEGEDTVKDLTGWTTPAYEELWLQFAEGIGLSRDEVTAWRPFTRTYYAQTTLCMLSRDWEWSWLDGIASLYAGDLHGKQYLGRAYEALKDRVPEKNLEFFRVYLGDVDTHLPWERDTLAYWCCTRERQLTAAKAFRYRLDIENQLLVRPHTAATSDTLPVQVPEGVTGYGR
jgi:pyrroloquinoline quinone (PQQ) biosynthesis protein C